MSSAEYFATGAAYEEPIYSAVLAVLEPLGPLTVEFVTAGIFFKRGTTFAELRPMRRWIRLSLMLSRRLESPRFSRTWHGNGRRHAYFVDLRSPSDVDQELRDWLTESYLSARE